MNSIRAPSIREHFTVLKKAADSWIDDRSLTQSAALSYYTVFSIAPLLLIALALAGIFFGPEASRGEVFSTIRGLIGDSGAKAIEAMVEASAVGDRSVIATVVGLVILLIGATTVFSQLQDALNQIWKVESEPGQGGIWLFLRQRVLSFALILAIAFLLLVSLLVSAALSAVGKFASTSLPGGEALWQALNLGFSVGFVTVLFAAIYKILPDVQLAWRDVWSGAFLTALLFTVGKWGIGLYLGQSGIASTYGAAGAAVIILVWAYYSSAILLFGAEITRIRTLERTNGVLRPKKGIRWVIPPQKSP